jgi:hypothetical protein
MIICVFLPNLGSLQQMVTDPTTPVNWRLGIELLLIYVPGVLAGLFLGWSQRKPEYDFGDERKAGLSVVVGALSLVSVFGFAAVVFLLEFILETMIGPLDATKGLMTIILTVVASIGAAIGCFLIAVSYEARESF